MSNGTFDIPELRCDRHFYGAPLCGYQAQAPVNEGIVIVPRCPECEAVDSQMIEALRSIATRRANKNSNPDVMAEALETDQREARAALRAAGVEP